MIDDGELDWKLIAIQSSDPLASKLNDIDDVEKTMPGVVSGELMLFVDVVGCFYYAVVIVVVICFDYCCFCFDCCMYSYSY